MKTQGTKKECEEIEEKVLTDFQKEFNELCEKFHVDAIAVGTRKETENFTDEPNGSLCAGFVACHISSPNVREAKAILQAYERAEDEVKETVGKAVLREILGGKCECAECKREERDAKEERKISYKKDGNKICATFGDFVNLQESAAGFGDTKAEAKEDLYRAEKTGTNIVPNR